MGQAYLHVDLILAALIGYNDGPGEAIAAAAERGEAQFLIQEMALYYALCSVQADDRLDFSRLCRLLRCASIVPCSHPFEHPGAAEIARWREAALQRI